MPTVSVAKAKSHLSELLAKSAYNNEKFIITRRNKPMAALVSLDDLRIIEQHEERKGLAALSGKWHYFEELSEFLDDLETLRTNGGTGRDVSF
ncbi:MAG: type II toxin-antitoxin system Phd/YefM family antitoxin [Desulfosarcina sp.]|nr:type II toxin-antitoxin system Phd/YefM family antitoxin [Desulfobacterales bacterium]